MSVHPPRGDRAHYSRLAAENVARVWEQMLREREPHKGWVVTFDPGDGSRAHVPATGHGL